MVSQNAQRLGRYLSLAWIIHEVSKKCRKESLKRFRIKLSNILIASIVP